MPVDFYKDEAGEWRWRLTSKNGEVVALGEGHTTEVDAHRAFTTMVSVASDAHQEFEEGKDG